MVMRRIRYEIEKHYYYYIYIFLQKYLRYAARCSTEGAEKCAVVVQHADKHILSGAVCEQKQCASDISDTNCA